MAGVHHRRHRRGNPRCPRRPPVCGPRPYPREGLGRFRVEGLTAARKPPLGREAPIGVAPDVRLDPEALLLVLVEVDAARLPLPLRARLAEPGGYRDDHRLVISVGDLELAALAHRCLVNVSREYQVGTARDERAENVVPAGDRLLPGAPG